MGGEDEREWLFVIPIATPSVNALNNVIWSQRRVVPKPEVLKWRSDASCFIPRITLMVKDSIIRVDLTFHYPFHYRNGNMRMFDTHNLVKCLLDTIAWKAGFNDLRIKQGSWASVDSIDEKVEVRLREISQ
jgi:Holliday junction resolvase RusA-like endonuclease